MRIEFGVERTSCGCEKCKAPCRVIPGYLLPSDLERLMGDDPYQWAETHLRASPGALVSKDGESFRIPTLVPATVDGGACAYLFAGLCSVHSKAPFGCAFFNACETDPVVIDEQLQLSKRGLSLVYETWQARDNLYCDIWIHLNGKGLVAEPPEVRHERLRKMEGNGR